MFSNSVVKKIVWYLEILLAVLLLAGAFALAFEGVPLLLIFLSHYFSEVKLGLWLVSGGFVLAAATLLYILLKKH
jgi:hypothetical protein